MPVPDGVMELLGKLKAMTIENGCTPSEAQSAASRLHAILLKHQLSIADVGANDLGEPVVENTFGRPLRKPLKPAHSQYAGFIGRAFECRTLASQYEITFVGTQSDATVARWFFEATMQPVIEAGRNMGLAKGLRGHGLINYGESFLQGAGVAIADRLEKERKAHLGDNSPTGALIRVKGDRVESYYQSKYAGAPAAKKWEPSEGCAAGFLFGSTLPLPKGIEGGDGVAPPNQLEAG